MEVAAEVVANPTAQPQRGDLFVVTDGHGQLPGLVIGAVRVGQAIGPTSVLAELEEQLEMCSFVVVGVENVRGDCPFEQIRSIFVGKRVRGIQRSGTRGFNTGGAVFQPATSR